MGRGIARPGGAVKRAGEEDENGMRQLQLPMRVWDLPTRLFHWAIVILVFVSWLTDKLQKIELHKWSGYTILTLLLFRIIWGFVGSQTSRFSAFLKSPVEAIRHLSHLTRREPDREVGHNAAGGWMVLVMLALLLIQAVTGLFSNDDISFEGPLYPLVGKDRSDWLGHIHAINFTLIELVIAAHLLAIIAYAVLKKHDLVRPMVTGKKRLPGATPAPFMMNPILAVIILVVVAGVVALALRYLPALA
jgi:cytochrome b